MSTWAKVEHVVPLGLVMGLLLLLSLINNLPKIVGDKLVPILYVDDTSTLLLHSNPTDFNNNITIVFKILTDWINLLKPAGYVMDQQ
jgi:hypothetical protein